MSTTRMWYLGEDAESCMTLKQKSMSSYRSLVGYYVGRRDYKGFVNRGGVFILSYLAFLLVCEYIN